MTPLAMLLSLTALVSGSLAIVASVRGQKRRYYLFKPATTLLIIVLALHLAGGSGLTLYSGLILAGLVAGLAGDIFLMGPERWFLAGLGSFLVGHWLYIGAFSAETPFTPGLWWLPLTACGVLVWLLLRPGLGRIWLPVLFYIATILLMAGQAIGRWSLLPSLPALAAAAGAVLFMVSDGALALNRFRQPFRAAQPLVLATYWAAQWLIALSLG
jgi:uncharacterized membrane protein YhhN